MGVNNFLKTALQSAGTPIDLRHYRDGIDAAGAAFSGGSARSNDNTFTTAASTTNNTASNQRPSKRTKRLRPLRIAVDVSHWIYRATHRFGPMLADERHLTNYGRYELVNNELQQQQHQQRQQQQQQHEKSDAPIPPDEETARRYVVMCTLFVIERLEALQKETNAEVLVVLDGATPPIKMVTCQERSKTRKANVRARDAPIDMVAAAAARCNTNTNNGNSNGNSNSSNKENNNNASTTTTMEEQLEKRIKANKRAGAGDLFSSIVEELLVAMRQQSIPYLVAPYEADGQLAWLSREGLVDLIVTEDSDLIAQGGACMIYKMNISNITVVRTDDNDNTKANVRPAAIGDNQEQKIKISDRKITFAPTGVLFTKDDVGAVVVSRTVNTGSPGSLGLKDMSDAMLAVMFVAAGSDYCKSLKGIGLVTACEIVFRSFLRPISRDEAPLARVFELLFQRTYDRDLQGDTRQQEVYRTQFLAGLLMYRHPVVYSPFLQRFVTAGRSKGDPELTSYRPYKMLLLDKESRARIVGDLMTGPIPTFIAEGWISPRTKELYESTKNDANLPTAVKRHFGLQEESPPPPVQPTEQGNSVTDKTDGESSSSPGAGAMQFDDAEVVANRMDDSDAEMEGSAKKALVETNSSTQEQELQNETQPISQLEMLDPANADAQEIDTQEGDTQFTVDSMRLETQPPPEPSRAAAEASTSMADNSDDDKSVASMHLETQAPPSKTSVDAASILLDNDDGSESDDGMAFGTQAPFDKPAMEGGAALSDNADDGGADGDDDNDDPVIETQADAQEPLIKVNNDDEDMVVEGTNATPPGTQELDLTPPDDTPGKFAGDTSRQSENLDPQTQPEVIDLSSIVESDNEEDLVII